MLGSVKRRISDGIRTENHTCIKKQSYGKVYKTDGRQFKQTGTGRTVSRFVGDDGYGRKSVYIGHYSMFAGACRVISILAVIWFQNKGLALVLFILLPFLFWFTRYVQKNMLAAQVENRRAVSRASGHVPETLHNYRTIHNLSKENYMEKRYDEYIQQSYQCHGKDQLLRCGLFTGHFYFKCWLLLR